MGWRERSSAHSCCPSSLQSDLCCRLGSHTGSEWWPGDPVTRAWVTQMTHWPGDPMTQFRVCLRPSDLVPEIFLCCRPPRVMTGRLHACDVKREQTFTFSTPQSRPRPKLASGSKRRPSTFRPIDRAQTFRLETETRGSIYKVSHDLSWDYRKFIVWSTYMIVTYSVLQMSSFLGISQVSLRTTSQTILRFCRWIVPENLVPLRSSWDVLQIRRPS